MVNQLLRNLSFPKQFRQTVLFVSALFITSNLLGNFHSPNPYSFLAHTQQTTSIEGKVTDEHNKTIAYATVSIKGTTFATLTDENGHYKIILKEGGTYEIVLSLVGYKTQSKVRNVATGQQIVENWNIEIDNKSLSQLDVTGKTENRVTKEQAYNLNVIEAKKLYNTSADLNQALNKTSGVRIREDGGLGSNFSFSLNGFSGKQIKFFLDGIPMDNFGSSLTLNNIPVNMVERIEIYKGVLPIHLGADALGGGVNVVTRTNPNYTDISYGLGSFNTHRASVNHAYSHAKTGFTYKINAFYNYSDNNYKINIKPIVNGIRSDEEQEFKRFHDAYESIALQTEAGVTGKKYADHLLAGLIASGNQKDIQTGVTMDQVFGARTSESFSLIPTLKYKKTNLFVKGLDLSFYTAYNMTQNQFIDTTRFRYDWFQTKTPTTTAEVNRTQLKNKDKEALITGNLAYRLSSIQSVSFNYVMTNFRRKSNDVEDPNNITFQYPQQLGKQVLGLAWQANFDKLTATVFSKMYVLNAHSFEQVQNGTTLPDYKASASTSTNTGYGTALSYFILPELQAKASY